MLLSLDVRHLGSLPQIENREYEYPNQVDEVPIEPRDLDDLIVAAAALVETVDDAHRDDGQINHAGRDVQPVKPRNHKEGRAELFGAHRVRPAPHALGDELGPLERLHTDA